MNKILTIFLLLTCIITAAANQVSNHLSLELVRTAIASDTENRCALRDSYGFLWIGTISGLRCFDGNGESVYDANSSCLRLIPNLHITTLYEHGDDILIGGTAGLYVFERNNNNIKKFPFKTKYGVSISSTVNKILPTGQGLLWIATQGQGLFIFNTADSTLTQDSRHGSFYSDIIIGANGLLYASTLNGQIQCYNPDGGFLNSFRIPNYVTNKNPIHLAASGSDIWIAANKSVYKFDIKAESLHEAFVKNTPGVFNSILSKADGQLFLGATDGVYRCNAIKPDYLELCFPDSKSDNISDVRVSSINLDSNGDLIVIHPTGSINFLVPKSPAFNFIPLKSDISDLRYNIVRTIESAPDNVGLLIGSDNGVDYYDLKTGQFDNTKSIDIGDNTVTTLTLDGHKLWIGTQQNGIYTYDFDNGTTKRYVYDEDTPYSVVSNEINRIYCTTKGEIYVLTNWGICRYDRIADNFPPLTEFGQQVRGITMQEDSDGGLWLATSANGLYYRKPGDNRFRNDNCSKTAQAIPVTIMHLDGKNRLWASTQHHGLYLYNKTSDLFPSYEIPLLNKQSVSFLANDIAGHLWIGTPEYLLQFEDSQDYNIYNFGRHPEWNFIQNSIKTISNGNIVIGCRNGFLMFDPVKLKTENDKIMVYPLSLTFPFVNQDEESITDYELNQLLYTMESVSIPYDNNTFTIKMSASRPISLPDIRFDYMLKGFDKDWITGSIVSEVKYSNIPPGDYNFQIRPHGIKNAHISEVKLTVLPPWYRSWWAYAIYLVLLLLLLWLSFITTRRFIRKNFTRRLNDIRVQKEKEMFEAKTRYFVDLVHEIRTPLMLISMPLEQISESLKNNTPIQHTRKIPGYLKSMQHNIDYLLGITNQLLDFRRIENNNEIQLKITNCNLNKMLADIVRRFDDPMKISNKTIRISVPDHDVIAAIDADKTERMLMNIIGNAMKYASSKIEIELKTSSDGNLSISVSDDGPGVPEHERKRIFDAYYQIGNDDVAVSLGTGLGLAYAKLVAKAHNGDISVDNNSDGGATFKIELPANEEISETQNIEKTELADVDIKDIDDAKLTGGKTILLVEDNIDLREMLADALGQYFTIVTAADGSIAVDILSNTDIDMIVSDVMMPCMNGIDLCKHVKSDINTSHIPFIILTAKTGTAAHEEGLECGADVYLEKPFPTKQLIYQISNLMRTRQVFHDRMRRAESNQLTEIITPENNHKEELNRIDAEFLEKMNTIISNSIANEEFSIDLLAERLNMSRSSFYRKITAVTGMSPSDYLKNYRLNYAAELLRDGCRVTEVSDRIGFTSSSYFAKCFKDKFSVLPSEYVESVKNSRLPKDR